MKSGHQGQYWIGGYEKLTDKPTGTLTSVPFKVTHPWASFLIGGGPHPKLFDVKSDPGELKDRIGSAPHARRFLTDAFGTWLTYQKRWHKAKWGVASNGSATLAGDLEANPTTASR